METNEIMTEVNESTEEVANANTNGYKIAAGIGLVIVVGGIAYKYAIKPAIAKIKAKKAARKADDEMDQVNEVEFVKSK